jgi:hypothetical protein
LEFVKAREGCICKLLANRIFNDNEFFLLRGFAFGFLFVHQAIELGDINGQTTFAGHKFGKVEGKAVGVGKLESFRSRKNFSLHSSVILSLSKDQFSPFPEA